MINWTYITSEDNAARYTLGKLGDRMLFFVGINPSKAHPEALDGTVKRVQKFASDNGHDGWVMLNVYPQRAKNPENIHAVRNEKLHQKNLEVIKELVENSAQFDVCAAWGTEINRRVFLMGCLRDIAHTMGNEARWVHLNPLTKHNHPRHPLYLPANATIYEFDIHQYLRLSYLK